MGYEDKIKEARRRRNNLNKARSRAMETRVMRRLAGVRSPMSGAGVFKGDGVAYSAVGAYLVECKLSSQTYNNEGSSIRVDYRYFTKLDDEVKSMRARFGIVVIHFLNHAQDYVIMREDYYKLLRPDYDAISLYTIQDEKSGYVMTRQRITHSFEQSEPYRLETRVGKLLVMKIDHFEQVLQDLQESKDADKSVDKGK
jgi:hypothetical protein